MPVYVEVRFLKDTVAFMGANLEKYGPFEAGDVAALPKPNASLLVKQGVAELTRKEPEAPTLKQLMKGESLVGYVEAAKSRTLNQFEAKPLTPPVATEYVKVLVLKDIPQFVGADMKVYGPYYSGEIRSVPKGNVELLVRQGAAEYPKPVKEPWEMAYREFFDVAGSEYTAGARFGIPTVNNVPVEKGAVPEERIHKAVIRKALSEGKPVPKEVLAEYPDLAPPLEEIKAYWGKSPRGLDAFWVEVHVNGKLRIRGYLEVRRQTYEELTKTIEEKLRDSVAEAGLPVTRLLLERTKLAEDLLKTVPTGIIGEVKKPKPKFSAGDKVLHGAGEYEQEYTIKRVEYDKKFDKWFYVMDYVHWRYLPEDELRKVPSAEVKSLLSDVDELLKEMEG